MKFDLERLVPYLGTRATDPNLVTLLQRRHDQIRRIEGQGFLAFKEEGVTVVFKDMRRQGEPDEVLLLSGFHFHRAGHESYKQYCGTLPNQISFNDTERALSIKMGPPEARGGGGISKVLKTPIPHWIRYQYKNSALTVRLDSQGMVELITLFDPNLHPTAMSRQQ